MINFEKHLAFLFKYYIIYMIIFTNKYKLMEKIPQKPVEKFSSNPTITEISSAIAALFDGHDITSEKIISSIEDVYALINNICTELPQHLKTQLLL